jgi:hypothetical protein
MGDTVKHRAAVVAEGRRQVRENLPFVLLTRSVRVGTFVGPWTCEGHIFVTSFVNDETTDLALISLFPEAPYEVLAVAAESGLLEESRHKAVILDHVDILLLEGAFPTPQFLGESGVDVAGPEGVLTRVILLVVRHGSAAAYAATDAVTAAAVTIADRLTER